MKLLAPSLLSANFANLEKDIKILEENGADILHLDVMDGHFVPNITIGIPVVEAISKVSQIPLDVHLMIEEPSRYLKEFIKAGASYISFHVEAEKHIHRTLDLAKSLGAKVGVALNPATPILVLEDVLPILDFVLIMTVNPGFGGQRFLEFTLEKVRKLKNIIKEKSLNTLIEVDGGIKLDNVEKVLKAGADIIVSGSGIFSNPKENTKKFKQILKSYF
ncbi:MAG TPA: ribulose-phosphate 3-epimerase [Desulfurobacteriaceae bacterium]|nr:ribulose-phosphate 3-epimerase [Desulfurobacteriaceae bacterium]